MSLFSDPRTLRKQSFAYGLSKFNTLETDSGDFIETSGLSVFVNEDGVTNISDRVLLHSAEIDPIDFTTIPQFSQQNNFIKGIAGVVPGVPVGGCVLYAGNIENIPDGYGVCDRREYILESGEVFLTPNIPFVQNYFTMPYAYIIRLPKDLDSLE